MNSCLYEGRVRHRRFEPKAHAFEYPVVYVYLDLDELDTVFEGRWLWSTRRPAPVRFRREDYFGDAQIPLQAAVRERIRIETGHAPLGPICLLTHLRHFGVSFNPVSFYYCFNKQDRSLETIVAEITNTPWNERHTYVLPCQSSLSQTGHWRFRFRKDFHVSPFMPMDIQYDWEFGNPGKALTVHMQNRLQERIMFEAILTLERQPIDSFTCSRALIRYPLLPLEIIRAIYWQAWQLFLKRTPFFPHPSKLEQDHQGGAKPANML